MVCWLGCRMKRLDPISLNIFAVSGKGRATMKLVLSVVLLFLIVLQAPLALAEEKEARFESDIRPILREYCLDCHGATEKPEGSLDLRLVRSMQQGGDSGSALVAGDPEQSLLWQRIENDEMPPGEHKLSGDKKALIKKWISLGAPTLRAEPESIGFGIPLTEEERAYWAYQPIVQPPSPTTSSGPLRTPLDALMQSAMPPGLTLSEDAPRHSLIRRVYLDLVGLPPSSEQMSYWLNHDDPNWYEQMVEQVLQSPAYGERWARHWLDAAGYADSDGVTLADAERPWAWRYRDYVIASLNIDKPFDRFIVEQLAGDELAGVAQGDWTESQIECLTATGFLRMAADGTGSGDNSPESRNKTIADTMQIVGSTLLGSSFNCAQCHDHRYDPISHQDYFALRAVFEPALDWQAWKTPNERLVSLYTNDNRRVASEVEAEAQKIGQERNDKQSQYMKQALDKELTKYEEPLRAQLRLAYETPGDKRTEEQKKLLDVYPSVNISPGVLYQYLPEAAEDLKKYDARIAEVRAKKPPETFLQALVEPSGHLPTTRLFHRGDHNQPTREVAPGKMAVLVPEGTPTEFSADDTSLPTSGRRLAFARWLTDSATPNPLLLRALVNRVWMHHFGRGIVATPGDFGRLGSPPTHPQVLDWLASQWVVRQWSLKDLHRLIMTSQVYRQSSNRNSLGDQLDPDNIYYWRRPIQRVDAEVLRDAALAVTGDLQVQMFGPPLALKEDDAGQVSIDSAQPRRSLYSKWRRTQPVALLQTFDAPVMGINCDIRSSSTVPSQSLILMNGDFVLEQAGKLAQRSAKLVEANRDSVANLAATWQPQAPPAPLWSYGTGIVNVEAGKVEQFKALPHYTGNQWQGGTQLPDPTIGWVFLSAQGGHPGNKQHPTIRRWTAPANGTVHIHGKLGHGSPNGDGVEAILCGPNSVVGRWRAKNGTVETNGVSLPVQAGEVLDLVVHCIDHETSDSFTLDVTLELTLETGEKRSYSSVSGFRGPQSADDYTNLGRQMIAVWQKVLLRVPTEDEVNMMFRFAERQITLLHLEPERIPSGSTVSQQVLTHLGQMLINSNEFLYVD